MENAEAFIRDHRTESVPALALLLADRPREEAEYILRQIEGWQKLNAKVPTWAAEPRLRYPRRLSLEQCSGELAARYKAEVIRRHLPAGGRMVDLTGGFGVDFFYLGQLFDEAIYVEQQADLCQLATHNLPLLGLHNARFVNADGVAYLQAMPPADFILLDPARRDGAGRKVVSLADCEPNVMDILPLLREKARYTLLKLSPMLDWHAAVSELGQVCEVHVFAEKGECKDLLLLLGPTDGPPSIHCRDGVDFSFQTADETAANCTFTSVVETYIYEPSAALLKAGALKLPALRFDLKKLHPNSHLYTSTQLIVDFPGRRFRCLRTTTMNKAALKDFCGDTKLANITVRNFPLTVDALRKKLHVKEGGNDYWFATTLCDGQKVIIACEKLPANHRPD